MEYKKYPQFNKPYVVVHKTGTGANEDPHVERKALSAHNTKDQALDNINSITTTLKSLDIIDNSSWNRDSYWVNVNLSCKEGVELYTQFSADFDRDYKRALKSGNYKELTVGDQTILLHKDTIEFFTNH